MTIIEALWNVLCILARQGLLVALITLALEAPLHVMPLQLSLLTSTKLQNIVSGKTRRVSATRRHESEDFWVLDVDICIDLALCTGNQ